MLYRECKQHQIVIYYTKVSAPKTIQHLPLFWYRYISNVQALQVASSLFISAWLVNTVHLPPLPHTLPLATMQHSFACLCYLFPYLTLLYIRYFNFWHVIVHFAIQCAVIRYLMFSRFAVYCDSYSIIHTVNCGQMYANLLVNCTVLF